MFQKLIVIVLPMLIVGSVLMEDLPVNQQFEGTVVESIDNSVKVHDSLTGQYETFIIGPESAITLDGVPVQVCDLSPCCQAKVQAEMDGATCIAISIEAKTVDVVSSNPVEVHDFAVTNWSW